MSRFDKINNIAKLECYLPTKAMKDLDLNIKYRVTDMQKVQTHRFGEQIIITLEDEFNVFLPARVAKYLLMTPGDYQELKESIGEAQPVFFRYLNGQFLAFEFITKEN